MKPMPLEVKLAMGRMLRMLCRLPQPGDLDEYHRIRAIILDASETEHGVLPDYQPCWARDRLKGARGD